MTSAAKLTRTSGIRVAVTALAIFVGYYAGANFGFFLRLPPSTPSVIWPPNAILTAALLLSAPRRWPLYLAAAFPAHLLAELGRDWSAPLVLAYFATNCSEALIAAVSIRWLGDVPGRFDTLRRVGVFIFGAVFLGPFLSSFLDAGVTALHGEPYWTVWKYRFFSNTLTELTVVPAVITGVAAGRQWLRPVPVRRRLEAIGLSVVVVVLSVVAFGTPDYGAMPGGARTPLAFLLPFLLWAAVRFGPGGASLAMLTTTVVAISMVMHHYAEPTREEIVSLQVFIGVIAAPLLCLAALIEERRRAQEALAESLRFEEVLSRLSAAFVHLQSHEMDAAFDTWLQRLGESLHLDHVILRRAGSRHQPAITHSWSAPGVRSVPPVCAANWPLTGDTEGRRLRRDQALLLLRSSRTQPMADGRLPGPLESNLTLPLVARGQILGHLVLDPITLPRSVKSISALRLLAGVFAGALARKEAEDALRASEAMKSAILTSLSTGVAVLDRDGQIVAVNESWSRFVREDSALWDRAIGIGSSYLDAWRTAAGKGVPHASDALAGIESVLARSRRTFAFEYADGLSPADYWIALSVVPLDRPEGGAVVSHTEVTERKRAEMEAQRSRQELAHFTRVSTMGELTASLAHELSQPLSGILTNAQAAQRFLAGTTPDLTEVRAILSDIVDDDKRAGEVIQRLRDLLRKSDLSKVPLDLNTLISDVARLLSSDAVIRNVAFVLELNAKPATVSGDRVELQQVILNLLLNAMEAMAETNGADRAIVLRTDNTDVDAVHVAIEDAGPGLDPNAERYIFEPFYTTKPAGMGMGLSIARSIVLAHDGLIWATNNPARGATFHLALPLCSVLVG